MADVKKSLKQLVRQFKKSSDLDARLGIAKEYIALQRANIHLFEDDISAGVPDHEVWRNIRKYEGIYQISNWGKIRAMEGFFIKDRKGGKDKMAVYKEERIRDAGCSKAGYPRISLWKDEKATYHNIHRLVALYFVQNPKKYEQVGHLDNNPSNPHFKNLVWGTQKHNIQYAIKCGRWHIGSKNGNSKLKEKDIFKIRKLLDDGVSAH